LVEDTLKQNRLQQEFEDKVMFEVVPRISNIEIPVSNLKRAIEWYDKVLGAKLGHLDSGWKTAMIHLQNGSGAIGVPSLFLVETEDSTRLHFHNTKHDYVQSVIDFYTPNLEQFYSFLQQHNVALPEIDFTQGRFGFGFQDSEGNSLGVSNVSHMGQEGQPSSQALIPRICTVEIPVANVKESAAWYSKIFGMKVVNLTDDDSVMLQMQGGNNSGVPTVFLFQTETPERLSFNNTNTGIVHGVIDYYTADLHKFHAFLKEQEVEVTDLHMGEGYGGFGFYDPNGNFHGACNAVHRNQE
jgi:catechol 2,3-dioxygenase-like lactoylglutathione lyase family enzyme